MSKIHRWWAIIFLTLLPTGCSANPLWAAADITPTPPEPAQLLIYTGVGPEYYEPYLVPFQAQYPHIEVQVEYDVASQVAERLIAEREEPQADVVWAVAGSSLLRAAVEGVLEPYAPVGLEQIDPRMRDFNEPPLWVGIDVFMSAFCVNTDRLAVEGLPMPTGWRDLQDPAYKNQLALPDPTSSTGYMAMLAVLHLFGEQGGWDYMDQVYDNTVMFTKFGGEPCRMASQGKVAVGVSYASAGTWQKSQGFPIEVVFPEEGSGWEVEANALVRKSPIKPEAKLFLDWAISRSAMQQYAQFVPVTAVETETPLPEGYISEPRQQLIPLRFYWAAANQDRIIETWMEHYSQKLEGRGAEIPDAFK